MTSDACDAVGSFAYAIASVTSANTLSTAVTGNRTVTITSADGTSVTIYRDSTGKLRTEYIDAGGLGGSGGYETRVRERVLEVGGVRTNAFITYNRDNTIRHQEKRRSRDVRMVLNTSNRCSASEPSQRARTN